MMVKEPSNQMPETILRRESSADAIKAKVSFIKCVVLLDLYPNSNYFNIYIQSFLN